MNNILIFNNTSDIYHSLHPLWIQSNWFLSSDEFFKSLDDNIIKCEWQGLSNYRITFKDEISKTFFILKYS